MPATPSIETVALHEATRHRYLNYALSVITARALPDVRDGLKPVQRRILYTMFKDLKLRPDARFRKSAAVVGRVMANYHPHGDASIYDALVRMAQPFSLRHPLVDGQGNFGSLDGDSAAAMRYTECRLQPLAVELLSEIGQRTVDFRPNYDGQHFEPIVLPAQFPQLLVNGAEGIAVGMATRIPPHNLAEVIDACLVLIAKPDTPADQLATIVRGPDFPTGGVILNTAEDLTEIYGMGSGSVRVRGLWEPEKVGRRHLIIITEIPYAVNKATLVEKIGDLIAARKVPQLVDVRDESTDIVRVVLELRKEGDGPAAMAFLCRHTPLQTTFPVNITCLVPVPGSDVPSPMRIGLADVLQHWLAFRYDTVRRRFEYELAKLRERIHILEGFEIVFDALDEAIALIRASEGKRDAAERLMGRFQLDDDQTEAILELRLYKLARLEILDIRRELAEKRAEAARIEAILASRQALWDQVRKELLEIRQAYAEPRRTRLEGAEVRKADFDDAVYVVAEDTWVLVSRDGWIKRQGSFSDLSKIRIKDGDSWGWIGRASTRSTVTFFTSAGGAYTMLVDDVPATTGYGEPVQAHFRFGDGEKVVGVVLHDKRNVPTPVPPPDGEEESPGPYAIAVSRQGRAVRLCLSAHATVSTKTGRRFMRPADDTDAVFAAYPMGGEEQLSLASQSGRAITFAAIDVNLVRGAGKGVTAIKLAPDDSVFAFELTREKMGGVRVVTNQGREEVVRPSKFAGSRAGRGKVVLKRGNFVEWHRDPLRLDQLNADPNAADEGEE